MATTNHEAKKEEKMTLMQAHESLGHINEHATKEISKVLGWKLTNMKALNCASCAGDKAKQKSLNKVNFWNQMMRGMGTGLALICPL